MGLERALLFSFAMHGLGMLAMVLLLLPGMPGGGTADDLARVHYIAEHPWLWRLGWLPWQLTALSDLLIGIALVRSPCVPRLPAVLTLLITIAAILPDQLGQALWITRGITLAQTDPIAYLPYEKMIFSWTAAYGAMLYIVGALGWTWCFAAGKLWSRSLTVLSIALWPMFALVGLGPLIGMNPQLVAAGNALAFVMLQAWFLLVTEEVGRRLRPETAHGRWAKWRHPRQALFDLIGNSRFLRACGELVPLVAFRGDVTDVIYVNYLLPAERLGPLVPAGLELDRVGANGSHALFTFLSYRNASFGPRLLGPLRRLLPGVVQSNWRIHVRCPRTGAAGIYFVTNAIDSTPHALAARVLAEGMPMHVLHEADVSPTRVRLDPGSGTAPDCEATLEPTATPTEGPWREAFASWQEFLAYCVPQDRAMSTQPWQRTLTRQEIDLGVPLDACEPLAGEVRSRAATAIAGDAVPFCFRVPRVRFLFARQLSAPLAA